MQKVKMFCLHEEEKQDFYSEPNTQENSENSESLRPHEESWS